MRHGLVELLFKVHRTLEAEGAVEPLPVVKHFDPFKDHRARLGALGKDAAMDQFPFQGAPEAFQRSIVAAVAAAAHARHHAGGGESVPVSVTAFSKRSAAMPLLRMKSLFCSVTKLIDSEGLLELGS